MSVLWLSGIVLGGIFAGDLVVAALLVEGQCSAADRSTHMPPVCLLSTVWLRPGRAGNVTCMEVCGCCEPSHKLWWKSCLEAGRKWGWKNKLGVLLVLAGCTGVYIGGHGQCLTVCCKRMSAICSGRQGCNSDMLSNFGARCGGRRIRSGGPCHM